MYMLSTYNESADLGFMYMAEQTSPEENSVSNLSFTDKAGVTFCQFNTVLHTFRTMNRNKRQYLAENVQERLNDERIQCELRDNAWYGEQDHPMQLTTDAKLTPERVRNIYLPNRSHKIMNPLIKGDILTATIQTASGTEAGRGFACEILQGLIPSFSCRSIAALKMIGGLPTVIIQKLVTYDWVLFPSHKEARKTGDAKFISKEAKAFVESTSDSGKKSFLKSYSKDVTIPLKEIMEYCGKNDVNTQMIMESFDITTEDLIGFDESVNHLIMKDHDNTIYVNISPRTKNEVRDFLSSF